jgi:hypothetical protein
VRSSTAARLEELQCDIRESVGDDGLLCMELLSDEVVVALARARRELGQGAAETRTALRDALLEHVQTRMDHVELTTPKPNDHGRWESRYVETDGNDIFVGPVWFDPASDETGPTDAAVIARAKMRLECRSMLEAKRSGMLGALVDILNAMAS